MKKCLLLFFIFFAVAALQSHAQFSRYIIRLKNKTGTPYSVANPAQFLTQRAIDRRTRFGIAIDETDLPITPGYIDSIRLAGSVTIINVSKWLNQVCISTTDAAALAKINSFSFVLASSPAGARLSVASQPVNKQLDPPFRLTPATPVAVQNVTDFYNYGSSYNQVHLHNLDFLHNQGFRGQGMQMAIIDDGFFNYSSLPTFDSARINNQILGTWDFVSNNSTVTDDDSHGMECLSTIAANMPGNFIGTAPAAAYYLYRTEDVATEYPVEEQNWAAAAERADSLGVDVFSVSLGYNTFDNSIFNHTYADMTGNTTIIARAANFAAKKGILVVAAAGNEGNSSWHYVTTLGDADSALTVGAVNINRQVAGFSSYGPNSDGQVKPDVAAVGINAVVANPNSGQPSFGNGTSFACPIMAGVTTCLWQAFPELKNLDIIDGLHQSADKFTSPDDRTGYGVPDVKMAFVNFIKKLHTQSAAINNCNAVFNYSIKASANMNVVIERQLPSDTNYVVVGTQNFTGSFTNHIFNYTDSLDAYTTGVIIKYRFKMTIGTDTSFYVDSASLSYNSLCPTAAERKICPATATYFSVNPAPAGYTYQWQVNKGSGFINITNDNVYSGTDSNLLILKNIPDSFYGYQYRCLQTNETVTFYSTLITLKFTSSWTGSVSTAWEDSRNWSCGTVPTQYIDVIIKNAVSNYPLVSSSAFCHALSTLSGASVTVKAGFKLVVSGH